MQLDEHPKLSSSKKGTARDNKLDKQLSQLNEIFQD